MHEFLIRKRPAGSNDPKQCLPIKVAKAKAEAIRKALLKGKDIDKVAEHFDDPPDVMLIDPKVHNLRRTEMKPGLSKATFHLKNGGVTEQRLHLRFQGTVEVLDVGPAGHKPVIGFRGQSVPLVFRNHQI